MVLEKVSRQQLLPAVALASHKSVVDTVQLVSTGLLCF